MSNSGAVIAPAVESRVRDPAAASFKVHRTIAPTMAPQPYALAATRAPRPSISRPAVHHRSTVTADRSAPTPKSAANVASVDCARLPTGITRYGSIGIAPATTNARNVAILWRAGRASSSG